MNWMESFVINPVLLILERYTTMKYSNVYKFYPILFCLLSFLLTLFLEFYWEFLYLYLPKQWHLILLIIAILLLWGITTYLLRIYHRYSCQLIRRKARLTDLGVILFFYMLVIFLDAIVFFLQRGIPFSLEIDYFIRGFSPSMRSQELIPAILYFGSAVIVAPILEELTFRGLFSSVLLREKSLWVRYVMTSFVFATAHFLTSFDLLVWLDLFFVSLFFQYVYFRRNSLWDAILLHSLVNGVLFVLFYHLPQRL